MEIEKKDTIVVIKGVIEDIVYKNNENGYTVVVLDCNGEMVTAVGKLPQVSEGEVVEMTGAFSVNSKYGEQFNVSGVKVAQPTSKEGIVRYLSSGLIKGVGPVTAMAIVDKFGEGTLDIMEFNPERLQEIRGISERKAKEIAAAFADIKRMQNAVLFLQQYNITTNMAVKIYNTYGAKTEAVLQKNPYQLMEDVDGIGFFTADKIAMKMGIEPLSEFRFRAGVLHILKENSDKNGNTFLPKTNLLEELERLLGLGVAESQSDLIERVLVQLQSDTVVTMLTQNDDEILVLTKYYNMEKSVADWLNELVVMGKNKPMDIGQDIDFYEKQNKITMHDLQREAVSVAVNSGVSVITGGPGTGKTTIVKCILQIFNNQGKTVKLLAPTGRAAKRLNESTGTDASTIHRALEVDFTNLTLFHYNQQNKLPSDVIIVDEVSMVDIQLFYFLLRAVKRGAQLVLVGDKDQLPSVGAGNVLADILASGVVPVVQLTQIYRQSEDSLIITNAHLINEGHMPIINNKSKDFFYYEQDNTESVLTNVIQMQTERIPEFIAVEPSKIQVLAPMKAGLCGIDNLNAQLQEKNNPPSLKKAEIYTEKTVFRVGDRVMQITNNYQREWKKDYEHGSGVFNGDIGIIFSIGATVTELQVLFEDGRLSTYNKSDLSELMLSYAITIHKSQGSEFDVVIIPIVGGPPMLLTKNLLYTAVTRAKKMVVLLGSRASIARMVHNKSTTVRFTLLKQLLLASFQTYKSLIQS